MMKQVFKLFTAGHIGLFRASRGRLGAHLAGMDVLLLTTTGNKSGKERTVPLTYIKDESGNPVITASAGGAPQDPAWFRNLKAHPEVKLELPGRTVKARAEVASPEARKKLWAELTAKYEGYLRYAEKTSREIPMVILKVQ
jgi:deazaflavin-dependent oxidoreductase (nitroreductase family)